MAIRIETLTYSPFGVNTYLIIDDQNQCIIVDPACYGEDEEEHLSQYLADNQLKAVRLYITHGHLDHIFGANYVKNTYSIPYLAHSESVAFVKQAPRQAKMYGLEMDEQLLPETFLNEGDKISFGNAELDIFYTPGHVDGSICIYCAAENWVIVGDVLFNGSIGRTDLPTGNFEVLAESIRTKLYILPDETMVYPGHGPETNIGFEKQHNPFVKDLN